MDEKKNAKLSKLLFKIEWVLGYASSITLFVCVFVAAFVEMPVYARILLIAFGLINFILGMHFCLVIEKEVGYYKCGLCHHCHEPTLKQVYLAMHYGRTRYLRCPKCGKRSWHKKTLENEKSTED